MMMSLEKTPQLGSQPVPLIVKLPASPSTDAIGITQGLQDMYRKGEFADIALMCAGQTFPAHRVVLAAQSPIFRQGLRRSEDAAPQANTGREEVRLADIANPEAVRIMLDHMYQMESAAPKEYNPRTQDINKDVLRLAQNFQLPDLTDQGKRYVAKDLSTGNVLERLTICEEFALMDVHEKILEQLTFNRLALMEVTRCEKIIQYPKLMQTLLQKAAAAPEDTVSVADDPHPKKKARR